MQSLKIAHADNGDNTILAAQGAGKVIRVLAYVLVGAGTVAAKWKSGASTDLTGPMSLVAASNLVAPPCISPGIRPAYFETAANEALVLNLSGAVAVNGHILYEVIG